MMATTRSDTVRLIAQCLCKAHVFTVFVSPESLPLSTACCHCTSCRRVTGGMYSCFFTWPQSGEAVWNSTLRRYQISKAVTVLFCGTCSSPMFFGSPPCDVGHGGTYKLSVCVGVLEDVPAVRLIQIEDHWFVGDTADGGASAFMLRPNPDGKLVPRWKEMPNVSVQLPLDWPEDRRLLPSQAADEFAIQCHCAGVSLVLRRGDAEFAAMKDDELPHFVDANSRRIVCGIDACDSCRRTFGSHLVHWTFSFLRHIDFPGGSSDEQKLPSSQRFPQTTRDLEAAVKLGMDARFGTLATYPSSAHVQRYFCLRCSASIFYATDHRPDHIDIALGLVHAAEGARAESLVTWEHGMIGHMEDVAGSWRDGSVTAVVEGSEAWRIEKGLPKCSYRIKKEGQIGKEFGNS